MTVANTARVRLITKYLLIQESNVSADNSCSFTSVQRSDIFIVTQQIELHKCNSHRSCNNLSVVTAGHMLTSEVVSQGGITRVKQKLHVFASLYRSANSWLAVFCVICDENVLGYVLLSVTYIDMHYSISGFGNQASEFNNYLDYYYS